MKTDQESKREETLPQSSDGRWKKHYEAPRVTILKPDPAKAQLIAKALAGDGSEEDLLNLVYAPH
jgi:hypothetical protein